MFLSLAGVRYIGFGHVFLRVNLVIAACPPSSRVPFAGADLPAQSVHFSSLLEGPE